MNIAKPEDIILEAIGYCFHKQKEYKKARQYYRKASQLNPKDDQIFYKIGETYTKESQWEKAIKAYSVALHINKDNATYCMALGNCLMEMNADKEIDEDIAMDMNQTDDYDDGDPWGEETENNEDYY